MTKFIGTIFLIYFFTVTCTWSQTQWIETSDSDFNSGGTFYRTTVSGGKVQVKPIATGNDWYNTSWQYRVAMEIDNRATNSVNLLDYQIQFTTNTQTLITAGKLKSDGSDIIYADENRNLLSHWVNPTTINTSSTEFWVKISSIAKDTVGVVYMYYGNTSTTTVSNRKQVFDIYEDWESGIDTVRWRPGTSGPAFSIYTSSIATGNNSASVVSGAITDNQSTAIQTVVNLPMNGMVNFWWLTSTETFDWFSFYVDLFGTNEYKERISGVKTSWQQSSTYQIEAGIGHILRWEFKKDSGGKQGTDQVWLDMIVLRKNAGYIPNITWGTEEISTNAYPEKAIYWSEIKDAGAENSKVDPVLWTATTPSGTQVKVYFRASNTLFTNADQTTPGWEELANGSFAASRGRYFQYRLNFLSDKTATANLDSITINYQSPPTAPTGFTGIALSTYTIRWNWIDNASGQWQETGYEIYNSTQGTSGTKIKDLAADTTYWVEGVYEDGKSYALRPNTGATRFSRAVNLVGGNSSSSFIRYTLSLPPNISTPRQTSSYDTDPVLNFYNLYGNFGEGYLQSYSYVWVESSTFTWTGNESQWNSVVGSTLTVYAVNNSTSWYIHVRSNNGDSVPNGEQSKGPFYFNGAPSTINDLSVIPGSSSEGEVVLTWTAPYADATWSNITNGKYIIRYATSRIDTDTQYNSATPFYISTTTPQGTKEQVILTGLSPGTSYFFAIKVQDYEGNLGALSNVPYIWSAKVHKIVFISDVQTYKVSESSGLITIELRDISNRPLKVLQDIELDLRSNSNKASFSLDNNTFGITRAKVFKDNTRANFYYRDDGAGKPEITVDETPDRGWQPGKQTQTVIPGDVLSYSIEHDGEGTVNLTETVKVSARDKFNNVVTWSSNTVKMYSSSTKTNISPNTFTLSNGEFTPIIVVNTEAENINLIAVDATYLTISGTSTALAWNGVIFSTAGTTSDDYVTRGSQNVPIVRFSLATRLTGPTSVSQIDKLRVRLAGSAVPGDISLVRLYLDSGDGNFNATSDSVIGQGAFDNNGDLSMDVSLQYITNIPKFYFITYDVTLGNNIGKTIGVEINQPDYFNVKTDKPVATNNLPFRSKFITIEDAPRKVTVTPNFMYSSSTSTPQGTTDFPMFRFSMVTDRGTARWNKVKVYLLAAGQSIYSDLTAVKIYEDADLSTSFELAKDKLIGTSVFTQGKADTEIEITTQTIDTTAKYYFFVMDVSPSAGAGRDICTVGLDIKVAADFTFAVPSYEQVDGSKNLPFVNPQNPQINLVRIDRTKDTLVVEPTPLAVSQILQGDTAAVLRLRLKTDPTRSEAKNRAEVTLSQLKLERIGDSIDSDIATVRVHKDTNRNAVFDAGIDELVSAPFNVFSSSIVFIGLKEAGLQIVTTTYQDYFVTLTAANEAQTNVAVGVKCAVTTNLIVESPDLVATDNFPFEAPTYIKEYPDRILVVSTSTLPSTVDTGQKKVAFTKFTMVTDRAKAYWTKLNLSLTGTGKPTDVQSVLIYRDSSGDNIFNPLTDVVVGSSSFNTDKVTGITISTQTITVSTQTFYVVFDFADDIAADQTFGVLFGAGDFTVSDPNSVNSFSFNSDKTTVNPIRVKLVSSTPFSETYIRQGEKDVPIMQLKLNTSVATSGLDKIKLTQYGTCADTDVVIGIYRDEDNDAVYVSTKDFLLSGTLQSLSNGTREFNLTPMVTLSTTVTNIFIVVNAASTAAADSTVGIEISTMTELTLRQLGATRVETLPSGFPHRSRKLEVLDVRTPSRPLVTLDTAALSTRTDTSSLFINDRNELTFRWQSTAQAGLSISSYSLVTGEEVFTAKLVRDWTLIDSLSPVVTIDGVNLNQGEMYHLLVRAVSTDGYISKIGSATFTVDYTPPSVPEISPSATATADAYWVNFELVPDTESGTFTVEIEERSQTNQIWNLGGIVNLYEYLPISVTEVKTKLELQKPDSTESGVNTYISRQYNNLFNLVYEVKFSTTYSTVNVFNNLRYYNKIVGGIKPVYRNVVTEKYSLAYRFTNRQPGQVYYYRVRQKNLAGKWSPWSAPQGPMYTSLPTELLSQVSNFPNPVDLRVNPIGTAITYLLNQDANVKIHIYDLFGYLVKEMDFTAGQESARKGENKVYWNGTDQTGDPVGKGMYITVIEVSVGGQQIQKRVKIGLVR